MIMTVEVIISNRIINSEEEILFKLLPIILIGFSSLVLTFLLLLLFFQIKNICLNSTTSEELRKESVPIPDFSFGSTEKNCTSFQNEIFSYKSLVNYNKDSQFLLSKNKMLVETYYSHLTTKSNSFNKKENDSKFELEYKSNLSTSIDV